jgi:hypothetical protein
MRPNGRRFAWIAVGVLLVLVVGALGFGLGVAAAHRGIVDGMPMRGFGVRYQGLGLLGLIGLLVFVGLVLTFVVLLFREPGRPTPPPPPPAPHDDGGVDLLREIVTMHERGQLTDEEFAAAKRKLLGI